MDHSSYLIEAMTSEDLRGRKAELELAARDAYRDIARVIQELIPDSPNRTVAVRRLLDSYLTVVSAIRALPDMRITLTDTDDPDGIGAGTDSTPDHPDSRGKNERLDHQNDQNDHPVRARRGTRATGDLPGRNRA